MAILGDQSRRVLHNHAIAAFLAAKQVLVPKAIEYLIRNAVPRSSHCSVRNRQYRCVPIDVLQSENPDVPTVMPLIACFSAKRIQDLWAGIDVGHLLYEAFIA